MVTYIKYFTFFLVVLWISAIWFVFKSGGITSVGRHPQYMDENNQLHEENNFVINSKWANRIKNAEQELTQLEAKIKQNQQIIQKLK